MPRVVWRRPADARPHPAARPYWPAYELATGHALPPRARSPAIHGSPCRSLNEAPTGCPASSGRGPPTPGRTRRLARIGPHTNSAPGTPCRRGPARQPSTAHPAGASMSMSAMIIRRLGWLLVLVLLISAITYSLFFVVPGDPAVSAV